MLVLLKRMEDLYKHISFRTSKLVTHLYSTSFSRAVSFLDRETRDAIYSVYGFVRVADEIVDTFHEFDKNSLLSEFERDFYEAMKQGISLNPVLNAFQITVKKYNIDDHLIQAFLRSMKIDLVKNEHSSKAETDEYIYGSAEVVGLMCLKIFVCGDEAMYRELEDPARKLGAAFQKVNFLRDLKNDMEMLNRRYFHQFTGRQFDEIIKKEIVADIENDFLYSFKGLKRLPGNARLGVYIAFIYYKRLLAIIKSTPADRLLVKRVRVPDVLKFFLLIKAYILNKLDLI